ncbi:MAG: hypothetical protein C0395_03165 [Gemmatimonas sp.]|nr:hypothetical protein [Gemmatimonas sp.]
MRSLPSPTRPLAGVVLMALILGLAPVASFAQDTVAAAAPADNVQVPASLRTRHPSVLAVSASYVQLLPLHILKEKVADINDLTAMSSGVTADFRVYLLDGLALSFGGTRSGFGLSDTKPGEMAAINERFGDSDPITPDNYLRLDGTFLNITAYLGNKITPGSRFNPYLRSSFLYYDWALHEDGRDSDVVTYQDQAIEGKNFGFGAGIGTEYRLNSRANLDLQLLWGYVLTGDEIKWEGLQSPFNDSYYWTNTHFWNLSLGLVIGI